MATTTATTTSVNSVEVNGNESWSLQDYGNRGLLMAWMQPGESQSNEEFLDVYDKEHGPLRMSQSWIHDGRRYFAYDGKKPGLVGLYTIDDYTKLQSPEAAALKEKTSEKENKINEKLESAKVEVYKQMSTRGDPGPLPVKGLLVYRMWVPEKHAEEVHAWYEKEHTGHIAAVSGWKRTRRYRNVEPRDDDLVELLALHEFADLSGQGSKEHMAAKEKPWRKRVVHELVTDDISRQFRLAVAYGDSKTSTEEYIATSREKELAQGTKNENSTPGTFGKASN